MCCQRRGLAGILCFEFPKNGRALYWFRYASGADAGAQPRVPCLWLFFGRCYEQQDLYDCHERRLEAIWLLPRRVWLLLPSGSA